VAGPEAPPLPPQSDAAAVRQALGEQLAYYFSAGNLARDAFLRAAMDAEGWVPTAMLATFGRVRSLGADGDTVAQCVRSGAAPRLELSACGRLVRLREGWQLWAGS
jgi:la-related protein 1